MTPESIPDHLAARFFDRLRQLRPASVLDVGCGRGGLLRACRDAAIPARGVEPGEERVAELRAAGLEVVRAAAEDLPFPDRGADWVTLRHVSHHLAAVAPALAEAFRVCRSGVLVAEPWLDPSIRSQRVARRFDAWLEAAHTRCGEIHRMPVSAGEFLAAVPEGITVEASSEHHLVLRDRPADWLDAESAPFLQDLPDDHPARGELGSIRAEAARDGLSCNGTAILVLRRLG